MREVYRIENSHSKNGMWYNVDGTFNNRIKTLCPNAKANDYPMGFNNDHNKNGKKWISAAKNAEQLHYWFSSEDAKILIDNGFELHCYTVSEYYEKEFEVLFTRESIVFDKIIPLKEVYKDL